MSGRSPRPDFGRTDYRFKINDNFGMLHETTLKSPGCFIVKVRVMNYNEYSIVGAACTEVIRNHFGTHIIIW